MATHLGVPAEIIAKPPAAGLSGGQTDEKELGFSYDQLEDYLLGGIGDPAIKQKVDQRRRANAHKLRTPKMPPPHPNA
jgi:NAD+ synthase